VSGTPQCSGRGLPALPQPPLLHGIAGPVRDVSSGFTQGSPGFAHSLECVHSWPSTSQEHASLPETSDLLSKILGQQSLVKHWCCLFSAHTEPAESGQAKTSPTNGVCQEVARKVNSDCFPERGFWRIPDLVSPSSGCCCPQLPCTGGCWLKACVELVWGTPS
jgi:hypothetical protein